MPPDATSPLPLPLALLALAALYGGSLGVGWLGARRARAGAGSVETFLAGRRLPWRLALFSMTATWVGGGYVNGTAEAVYDPARGLVWAQAPWCYALSLAVGGLVFARPLRRTGAMTVLDPFEGRYGGRTAAAFAVPAVLGEIFWAAAILAALGATLEVMLGLSFEVVIVLSAGLVVAYTARGGLWAVSYTDVLQLAGIAIGLGIAVPFALEHAGGWDAVATRYQARFGEHARLLATPSSLGRAWWTWLDLVLLLVLGGIPWQDYVARVLACRTDRQAVAMSLAGALGCVALAVPAALLGAVAATADWGASGPPADPATALPAVLHGLTPPWVATLGLTAVAAAVISSIDSSFLSAASLVSRNVAAPLGAPAGQRELGLAVALVGTAAATLALATQSVYALWALCADLVYTLLFPQLVIVLWARRPHASAALAGGAVALLLRVGGGEPLLGVPALLAYPWTGADGVTEFPFRTTAMLAGLATTLALNAYAGRSTRTPPSSLPAPPTVT